MPNLCSVPRGDGRYDYFWVRDLPRRRLDTPGMAALADALPRLPLEAQPDGTGEVARGVVCSRGGSSLGDLAADSSLLASALVGLVLFLILSNKGG